MRILFAIAHYFHPGPAKGKAGHGSLGRDPAPRLRALATCISALHLHYGPGQGVIRIADRTLQPANTARGSDIDVLVCTTDGRHLLDRPARAIHPGQEPLYPRGHRQAEPTALGFACAAALRERLGIYDWYCYMEDDIILHDPALLRKLAWFTSLAGDHCLLQPNRFEAPGRGPWRKVYIDGDLAGRVTAPFCDPGAAPAVSGDCLGRTVTFQGARNPHSGCWFLNARQMEMLAARPDMAEPSEAFVGPLESAATLRIMQAFTVYKTTPEHMDFLEVQHAGAAFASLIGNTVKVPEK